MTLTLNSDRSNVPFWFSSWFTFNQVLSHKVAHTDKGLLRKVTRSRNTTSFFVNMDICEAFWQICFWYRQGAICIYLHSIYERGWGKRLRNYIRISTVRRKEGGRELGILRNVLCRCPFLIFLEGRRPLAKVGQRKSMCKESNPLWCPKALVYACTAAFSCFLFSVLFLIEEE